MLQIEYGSALFLHDKKLFGASLANTLKRCPICNNYITQPLQSPCTLILLFWPGSDCNWFERLDPGPE
jgi:hypothetical protein